MRYVNLFETTQLNEAVNYEQLFDPVINLYKRFQDDTKLQEWGDIQYLQGMIKDRIKYIKSSISQGRPGYQNWIMYALKYERMRIILAILDNVTKPYDTNISKKLEKYFDFGVNISNGNTTRLYQLVNGLTRKLEHFSAYDYDPIKRYNPTQDSEKVIADLSKLEQEYFDRMGEDDRLLELEDGDKIIKDFGDGVVWIMLSRGACSEEGDAMGHCGNVPSVKSGDRIISLRKKRPRGNEMFYEPFATFIYNEKTKELGERKGRNNEKPVEKYYPYIVWLLKQDFIQGMNNYGYAPEDNFQLDDLDVATRKEVTDANPYLKFITGTPLSEFSSEQLTEYFTKHQAIVGEDGKGQTYNTIFYNVDTGKINLPLNIDIVVDSHLMNVVNDVVSYWYNDSRADINDVVSDLNESNMKTLYNYCLKIAEKNELADFPDFEEFSKQANKRQFDYIFRDDEFYDIEDDEMWEELTQFFDRIYDDALMNSYENSLRKNIISEIDRKDYGSYEPEVEFYFDDKFGSRSGYQSYIDEAESVILATNTFVKPDDADVIVDQISENFSSINDIDDRYLGYYADSETINSMFSDYWEFD